MSQNRKTPATYSEHLLLERGHVALHPSLLTYSVSQQTVGTDASVARLESFRRLVRALVRKSSEGYGALLQESGILDGVVRTTITHQYAHAIPSSGDRVAALERPSAAPAPGSAAANANAAAAAAAAEPAPQAFTLAGAIAGNAAMAQRLQAPVDRGVYQPEGATSLTVMGLHLTTGQVADGTRRSQEFRAHVPSTNTTWVLRPVMTQMGVRYELGGQRAEGDDMEWVRWMLPDRITSPILNYPVLGGSPLRDHFMQLAPNEINAAISAPLSQPHGAPLPTTVTELFGRMFDDTFHLSDLLAAGAFLQTGGTDKELRPKDVVAARRTVLAWGAMRQTTDPRNGNSCNTVLRFCVHEAVAKCVCCAALPKNGVALPDARTARRVLVEISLCGAQCASGKCRRECGGDSVASQMRRSRSDGDDTAAGAPALCAARLRASVLCQHTNGETVLIPLSDDIVAHQLDHMWTLTRRTIHLMSATRDAPHVKAAGLIAKCEAQAIAHSRAIGLPMCSIQAVASPVARMLVRKEHPRCYRKRGSGDLISEITDPQTGNTKWRKLTEHNAALAHTTVYKNKWAQDW